MLKIFLFLSCLTLTIISGVLTFQQKEIYNKCLSNNNCSYTIGNCKEVIYDCENESFSGHIYLFLYIFLLGIFATFVTFLSALPSIEEMYLDFTTPMPKVNKFELNN